MTTKETPVLSQELIDAILDKMPEIDKERKDFITHVLTLYLTLRCRMNFLNMERFGGLPEHTYRFGFKKDFDFLKFCELLIMETCGKNVEDISEKEMIAVFDPSFVSKSGKETPGTGKYWCGCDKKAKWGTELGGLCAVDVDKRTAMHLEAVQTPRVSDLKANGESLVDHYARVITDRRDTFKRLGIKTLAVDAYFTAENFVRPVLKEAGLHVVGRLQINADMRYLYEPSEEELNKPRPRGRPREFGDKINWNSLQDGYFDMVFEDKEIRVWTAVTNAKKMKMNVRVVIVEKLKEGKVISTKKYYSTDKKCGAKKIYDYYKIRFQVEFNFRDAKQHTGLEHCQARNKEALHFHFNASLTAVSIAKAISIYENSDEPERFSMANVKTELFNDMMVNKIYDIFISQPEVTKNDSAIQEILKMGIISA